MERDDGNQNKDKSWPSSDRPYQEKEDVKLWGIFLFGLIGATATTFAILIGGKLFCWTCNLIVIAIWQVGQLRRTVDWFYAQLSRSQSAQRGASGSSFRSSFQEEAWKRYNRRMREEYEEEMERVERIRRMQSVFNRERNKYKKSYESWRQNDYDYGAYHHHFQRDDWYWKADTSYREQRTNFRPPPSDGGSFSLSHHYSVLGLDRFRKTPYTEAEIKTAFRTKAKEFHPDQNQDNKEAAEAKFKEVMVSYEAIRQARRT